MLIKLFILVLAMVTAVAATQAMPDCPSSCGDLKIPYPFGTSNNCIIDEAFLITCNHTFDPPTPFLRKGHLPVLNISLEEGQLRINPRVYYKCYHSDGETSNYLSKLKLKNFTISSTKNKFTAIGCDTRAVIRNDRFFTGCFSFCYNFTDVVNRSCSGIGCCQTTIPSNVTNYRVELESYYNYSYVSDFNECGYAFIVEDDSFNFTSMDLKNLRNQRRLPMVLDWSIGSQTCDQAKEDPITYACKGNSYCTNSQSGVGYLCHCLPGFEGNPYLNLGCADVDECKTPRNHRCTKTCHNTFGAYNCSCPIGYNGDGWSNGTGCNVIPPHQSKFSIASVVVGITISLLAALLGISWLQMGLRQRKLQKLRQKFFDENGGSLLKQELAKCEGISGETIAQIYTAEDLKKATENYHESRILGRGGQGTVYKGLLTGKGVVAIKRSRIGDRNQVEEFVNEVIVVSQINHRNVVKLLGCCLETEVPLLVYEFVPNSTLFHHIHNAACSQLLRWETRLKIAIEVAGALSYLHFSASTPIVHRDIKSMNILLDHNYTAKIADFGSSRFIPLDKTDLTTLVQGTLGYLDPEYMHSNQLTDKSDVYSFGVVLIELLTGEKAFSFQKLEQERNLAMSFVSAMKEDQFLDVVDHRLLNRSDIDQIKEVAMLARECVRVKGEERPTMKEVANKLEGLRARGDHSSSAVGDSRTTKIESLHNFDGEGSSIIGYDSLKYMEIEGGR